MKHTSKTIVFLTVVGLALLLAGGFYFRSPLFGQVILGGIIAIFGFSQFKYFRTLGHLEAETDLLPRYQEQEKPEAIGEGIIANRIKVVKRLAARRFFPDAQTFSETMAATEGELVTRSPGGLVVMLGLLGTFYGLMNAVSTAGGTMNMGSNAQSTLASVQMIFSSMQGIFGTSLAGLVAALMLNATHAMVSAAQNKLLASIEEYTQFKLLPAFAPSSDPAERQMELMVEKLGQVTLALQQGIQERNEQSLQMLRAQVADSSELLREGLQTEIRALAGELTKLTGGYAQSLSASGQSAASSLQGVLEGFRTDFADMQRTAAQSLNSTVQQVSQQIAQTQASAIDGMRATVQSLSSDLAALQQASAEGMSRNVASLSTELAGLQQAAAEGLRASVADMSSELSRSALAQLESYQAQWKDMAVQANAQLEASRGQWSAFMDALKETSAESLVHQKEGLSTLRDVAEQVAVKALDESANLSSTFATQIEKLSTEVQSSFGQLAGASKELVEAQGRLLTEMENRIAQEKEAAAGFSGDLGEAATLMRINQSEFQASLEMFRMGVEHILEKFTGNSAEQESQRNFIEQLHASLEAFHEKASEVLVENAMRTQEILLEVLEQARPAAEGKAEA